MPGVCVELGDTPEISSQHSSEVMAPHKQMNLCNKKFAFQVKIRLWAKSSDGKPVS